MRPRMRHRHATINDHRKQGAEGAESRDRENQQRSKSNTNRALRLQLSSMLRFSFERNVERVHTLVRTMGIAHVLVLRTS